MRIVLSVLPNVKPEEVEITITDDVLTLTIPKSEKVKPKQIRVKARAEEEKK